MGSDIKIPALLSVSGKGFGFAASAYVAYTLGPENFAFYAMWLLTLEYLAYSSLGLGPVMFRNVSISESQGRFEDSQATINLAVSSLLIASFLGFCVIFLAHLSDVLPIHMSNIEFSILILARLLDIWLGLTKSISKGLGILLPQTWVEGVLSISMPLINVLAVTFFGVLGLMLAHMSMAIIGILVFRFHDVRFSFSFAFDYPSVKGLLKTALPLFSANFLETTLVTLPIFLSGLTLEAAALGGFLYLFQNSRSEKIPLYRYFSSINYRFLLIEASKDAEFGNSSSWGAVNLAMQKYFFLTLLGTLCFFVALNFVSRVFLNEYTEYLNLIALTVPSLAFFSLRRIFNAYFSAINKLSKRIVIYLLGLGATLVFFTYFGSIGSLVVTDLALWITFITVFCSTLGLTAFLKDIGHSNMYIFKAVLSILSVLLVTYLCSNVLLYYSEKIEMGSLFGMLLLGSLSFAFIIASSSIVLSMIAVFNNQSLPDLLKVLSEKSKSSKQTKPPFSNED